MQWREPWELRTDLEGRRSSQADDDIHWRGRYRVVGRGQLATQNGAPLCSRGRGARRCRALLSTTRFSAGLRVGALLFKQFHTDYEIDLRNSLATLYRHINIIYSITLHRNGSSHREDAPRNVLPAGDSGAHRCQVVFLSASGRSGVKSICDPTSMALPCYLLEATSFSSPLRSAKAG